MTSRRIVEALHLADLLHREPDPERLLEGGDQPQMGHQVPRGRLLSLKSLLDGRWIDLQNLGHDLLDAPFCPATLADEVLVNPEHVADIGVEWALKQSQELLDRGVPSLHFYVMQSASAIKKLMARLKI